MCDLIENQRYSPKSSETFSLMKKIYKYHQYDRKDGSVVNKLLLPDDKVIEGQNNVSKLLIEEMKKIQITKDEPSYNSYIPFPELPLLNDIECKEIMENISTNKALALDGVSDIIFNQENINYSCKVLSDIWNVNWDSIPHSNKFFQSRLIPLNKVHPKLPSPRDFRPIIISSSIVKLLESRLLPKIRDYLTTKLYRGQTGFVSGMGTSVNLGRLTERYKKLMEKKTRGFALFVDFKSAYNTVLHSKLFKRLKKVLSPPRD